MKVRCKYCGKKIDVEIDIQGIPMKYICNKCEARELEKELFNNVSNKGKKRRNWWKK